MRIETAKIHRADDHGTLLAIERECRLLSIGSNDMEMRAALLKKPLRKRGEQSCRMAFSFLVRRNRNAEKLRLVDTESVGSHLTQYLDHAKELLGRRKKTKAVEKRCHCVATNEPLQKAVARNGTGNEGFEPGWLPKTVAYESHDTTIVALRQHAIKAGKEGNRHMRERAGRKLCAMQIPDSNEPVIRRLLVQPFKM